MNVFYEHKKLVEYSGYQIIVFKSKILTEGNTYLITIFNGKKQIGKIETDNDVKAVKEIKARIDRSEERVGRLEFI